MRFAVSFGRADDEEDAIFVNNTDGDFDVFQDDDEKPMCFGFAPVGD